VSLLLSDRVTWGKWHTHFPREPYSPFLHHKLYQECLVYNHRRRSLGTYFWEARRYRLWGRWDDVLFHIYDEPDAFYARFGVEWQRALAAVYECLQHVDRQDNTETYVRVKL